MGDQHLEKVRGKLEEITSFIEDADERILTRKNNTAEAMARNDKLEVDLAQAKRRILLIQEDLRATNARLAEMESKLAKVQSESEEIEKVRDEMEANEGEMEVKIENLEEGIRETKIKHQVNLSREVECERKEGVCTAEIAKLREKAEISEARVAVLEGELEGFNQSLSEIEEREAEAGEREDLNEEKVAFLERELKETTMRAEAAERMSMVLYNSNVEVNTEVHKWVTQREEMLANMFTMDDVADDPAYNCFNIVAAAGGGSGGDQ